MSVEFCPESAMRSTNTQIRRTVEIRADVIAPRLARRNRLLYIKQGRAQRCDSLLVQLPRCHHRRARDGDLDSVPVPTDSYACRLGVNLMRILERGLSVVCVACACL